MTLLLLVSAIVIVAAPLVAAGHFALTHTISPLHVLAASLFLGVGLKTVAWLVYPERTIFYQHSSDPSNNVTGYIYVMLFVICVCVGYAALGGRWSRPRTPPEELRKALQLVLSDKAIVILASLTAIVAAFVTWFYLSQRLASVSLSDVFTLEGLARLNVAKLDRIEGESFGLAYSYITVFFAVIPITLALLISQFYVRRPSSILVAATILVTALWISSALVRGKRGDLIELFGLFAMIHFCFRRSLSMRALTVASGGMIATLAVFSLMTAMRVSKSGLVLDGADALQTSLNQIFYSTYFFDINISSLIITEMDLGALRHGQTYLDWVTGLVPRALWPDKPAISLGLFVKSEILHQPGTIGGVNPTMAGEAYINFGWFGVFVGVLAGMLFRWIERALLSPAVMLMVGGPWLYAWLSFSMVWALAQTSFSIYVTGLIVELSIVALVILFIRWAFPRAMPRLAPSKSRPLPSQAVPVRIVGR